MSETALIQAAPINLDKMDKAEKQSKLVVAANEARGLAMDAIVNAGCGHFGIPLGCAEMGSIMFTSQMMYNPQDPTWINRDRFIESAGHGSMFTYGWLHMVGYDIEMEDIKQFRQMGSKCPGHPEFHNSAKNTPGLEATTGALGQGVSNAVGMAACQKMAAARYNTPEHTIFDHNVWTVVSDGDMQEGISHEASCWAAHEKLDNLIVLYDDNKMTLDNDAGWTQSEDICARYRALGWDTYDIDGHDLDALEATMNEAKSNKNGKPKFVKCRIVIGKGMKAVEGKNAAHSAGGIPFVDKTKEDLNLPVDERFYVSQGTREFLAGIVAGKKEKYNEWKATYEAWKIANPEMAKEVEDGIDDAVMDPQEMLEKIPCLEITSPEATRVSEGKCIQHIAKLVPNYVSGSGDLHGSCQNYIKGAGDFGGSDPKKTYAGKNMFFGIREHAMGAIMNGFAYYGLFKISGSTFLAFVDYMKATVRTAAISALNRVSYILTHDSVGVGEDGPSHQPVETYSGLRCLPNLDVYRPGDAEETVAAMVHSVTRKEGPTALILSRQKVPQSNQIPYMIRRRGALNGAYIAKKEEGALELIILATGSELPIAMEVGAEMPGARVVSMPCMEVFDRQSAEYKESVLPAACTKRISIEAGVGALWYKYTNKVVSIEEYGFSAPGPQCLIEMGMSADNLRKEIASMD